MLEACSNTGQHRHPWTGSRLCGDTGQVEIWASSPGWHLSVRPVVLSTPQSASSLLISFLEGFCITVKNH